MPETGRGGLIVAVTESRDAWGNVDPVREIVRDGGTVVARLVGELDLANAAALRTALFDAAAHADRLVVDLGAVTFVDSTILGVIVETRRALGSRPLLLAAPNAETRRALEVTGLERHLGVYDTVDDALRAS